MIYMYMYMYMYIYIYIYIYIRIYTYPRTLILHDNRLGELKKCVKMCDNPNSVSYKMKTISYTLHIWDLSNALG